MMLIRPKTDRQSSTAHPPNGGSRSINEAFCVRRGFAPRMPDSSVACLESTVYRSGRGGTGSDVSPESRLLTPRCVYLFRHAHKPRSTAQASPTARAVVLSVQGCFGAGGRRRTCNLPLTGRWRYRLRYACLFLQKLHLLLPWSGGWCDVQHSFQNP